MIAIIDYGAGNLQSVKNALNYLKADSKITSKTDDIEQAEKIIFPGVGSFGNVMKSLEKESLIATIKKAIKEKPYLGICLGLQVLFEKSEESPDVEGFGIFKGDVKKFTSLKIPQIGWNSISMVNKKSSLLQGIKDKSYLYFVHSYYVAPKDKSIILTKTDYGINFVSSIEKGSIFAVQFHPERSGDIGLKILKNFIDMSKTTRHRRVA